MAVFAQEFGLEKLDQIEMLRVEVIRDSKSEAGY
jgi:hypothetical protein